MNRTLSVVIRQIFTLASGAALTYGMIPVVPVYATTLPTVSSVATQGALDDLSPEAFLSETNAIRRSAGRAPLSLNPNLMQAAESKAADMLARGYWDHFRPDDNKAPWDFITEAGYKYSVAGENLARGFKTAQGITAAWYNSPSHKANLLSDRYTDVGYATIETTDAAGATQLVTVQMFGAR